MSGSFVNPEQAGMTAICRTSHSIHDNPMLSQVTPVPYELPSRLRYLDSSHSRQVNAYTAWIVQRTDELVTEGQDPPLVVPLTVTFAPNSTRPDRVLREYERFYARLCR